MLDTDSALFALVRYCLKDIQLTFSLLRTPFTDSKGLLLNRLQIKLPLYFNFISLGTVQRWVAGFVQLYLQTNLTNLKRSIDCVSFRVDRHPSVRERNKKTPQPPALTEWRSQRRMWSWKHYNRKRKWLSAIIHYGSHTSTIRHALRWEPRDEELDKCPAAQPAVSRPLFYAWFFAFNVCK